MFSGGPIRWVTGGSSSFENDEISLATLRSECQLNESDVLTRIAETPDIRSRIPALSGLIDTFIRLDSELSAITGSVCSRDSVQAHSGIFFTACLTHKASLAEVNPRFAVDLEAVLKEKELYQLVKKKLDSQKKALDDIESILNTLKEKQARINAEQRKLVEEIKSLRS